MTVRKLLELANAAPSAGNAQARDFVVVRNNETKNALAEAALGQSFISEAAVVIVVCGNLQRSAKYYGNRGMSLYYIQDADAAVQNLLLAVHNEGLGSCWVGAFDERSVTRILKLPDEVRPLAIIPIGVPAKKQREGKPNRVKIEKLVHFEQW
jgi:nitroreductase